MQKIFLITGLFIVSLFGLAAFCTSDTPGFNDAANNYQEYCAGCHGEKLEAFVDRQWIYGNSWNEIYKAIKLGYPDDGMPDYDTTFTDQQLNDLVSYILDGIERLTEANFEAQQQRSETIQSEEMAFKLDTLVTGLGVPWGLAFLPNGDMLITERSGEFHRYTPDGQLQSISGVPKVLNRGQGGLMDVEVHPSFDDNQFIYLSYSKPQGDRATTAVMRAKLENDKLTDQQIIFEAKPYLGTRHHYGSRLEFDREGYLYISVGDRGRRDDNPQSLDNHCGKILRIHDDGRIPEDNPFVNTSGAMAAIYSYGHRNPQGVTLHPETGEIWTNEHGPRGGDEVNRIQKGRNYGWPVISYGINYNGTKFTDLTEKEGMEQPGHYWVPSIGVCGMTFVSGDRYPNWKGDILNGSLRFDYISRLKMKDGEVVGEEKLLKNVGRLRDVKMGNDGYIYFTVEDPGRVFRIVPN